MGTALNDMEITSRKPEYVITSAKPRTIRRLAAAFSAAGVEFVREPQPRNANSFVVRADADQVSEIVGRSPAGYELNHKAPD